MRANPGGEISSDDTVGRDQLIKSLWDTLSRQSVILVSERRMGKTTVVKKMRLETPVGMQAFYRDVENLETPAEFVERVFHDVEAVLGPRQRVAAKTRQLLQRLSGAELTGIVKFPATVTPHWKVILEQILKDLDENSDRNMVFFWDEFPLMLHRITNVAGAAEAMSLLDTLRQIRQSSSHIRMVFTGSIGLHHITAKLRHVGHTNDAANDMRTLEVTELSCENACLLGRELIRGEGLNCPELEMTAQTISTAVDRIPFYIHGVVAELKDRGDVAKPHLVQTIVRDALVDPHDRWHLKHFFDRLGEYYGHEAQPLVLEMLDELAAANVPLNLLELHRRIVGRLRMGKGALIDAVLEHDLDPMRHLISLLERDHYVRRRATDGLLAFRFPLIQQWWRMFRMT